MSLPPGMKTPEQLLAEAKAGAPHVASEPPAPPLYTQEEIVCALTLDQRQAWLLMVLLGPYREANGDEWDVYLAAQDVRRRVAEALGYE